MNPRATILLAMVSCVSQQKMAWPPSAALETGAQEAADQKNPADTIEVVEPEAEPAPTVAAGGALEVETIGEIVAEQPEEEPILITNLPADIPRDGREYLLLQWPLGTAGINSLFGRRADPLDGSVRRHSGVDLDAQYGAVVQSAAKGYVARADWHAGHGRRVLIEHAGGFRTGYSHLSQVLVLEGTWVEAGQTIGRVGNSGRSTGTHLHFEISRWGSYLDPLDYLGMPIPLD